MLEHCPTDQMWTDINTKPKQGAVFREFRGQVMGIPSDYDDNHFASRIHLRPPVSPTSVPTLDPSSSTRKTILPVPTMVPTGLQECVGGNAGKTAGKSEMAGTLEKSGFKTERLPRQSVSWAPYVKLERTPLLLEDERPDADRGR